MMDLIIWVFYDEINCNVTRRIEHRSYTEGAVIRQALTRKCRHQW